MKKILILGAGNSGKSAANLAKLQGDAVTLLDSGSPDVQIDGVEVVTGKKAEAWSGPADLVIYSPGIPLGSRLDEIGITTGAPKVSELAYGASFLKCPILAVTGTNGKTTTVEMLEHCLNAAGHRAIAAGNIGLPISEVVASGASPEILVAEVSSFQHTNLVSARQELVSVLKLCFEIVIFNSARKLDFFKLNNLLFLFSFLFFLFTFKTEFSKIHNFANGGS